MSTAGPTICGTGANDAAYGAVAWSNPTRVTASDASYATASLGAGQISNYLKATNFGFLIPGGSTINGIAVTVGRLAGSFIIDSRVRIVKGGTVGATDKSNGSSWSSLPTAMTYGDATDLWGETWTPTDINASNFGFVISARDNHPKSGVTPSVDYISITVTYSVASGPVIPVFMNQYRQRRA